MLDNAMKTNGIISLKCQQKTCTTESKSLALLSQNKQTHFVFHFLSNIKKHEQFYLLGYNAM
jgi:hypothetical protein